MTILFLYTELAGYTLSCLSKLKENCSDLVVFHYPVNKEAPFVFQLDNAIQFIERKHLTRKDLLEKVNTFDPSIIICSGWIDKDYLSICKRYFGKRPTVLAMDTKWRGGIKQTIASWVSPFTIRKAFSHVWVPGLQQTQYAKKLGFSDTKIMSGFYCADTSAFHSYYLEFKQRKQVEFPKRFIFVGRYYDFKGITDLWEAFIQLSHEYPNDWELWCLGTGDIKPIVHPKIKHFGFIQPENLKPFIKESGVFILPSRFEPWAVVVHEFAAAGFPLVLSNEIGAAEQFLEDGKNGFKFKSGDISELKEKMKKIIQLTQTQLVEMADRSHELSKSLTLENWSKTIINIINHE